MQDNKYKYNFVHVCDCTRVLAECWQMMLFRCRAHRYICGRGRIISLHVNEASCQSCVFSARNDKAQAFRPHRRLVREEVEATIVLEKASMLSDNLEHVVALFADACTSFLLPNLSDPSQ